VIVACCPERDFAFGNSSLGSNMGIGNRRSGNFRRSDRLTLEMCGVDRRSGNVQRGNTIDGERESGGDVVEVMIADFLAVDAVVIVACCPERDFAFGNSGLGSNMGIGNRVILEMLSLDRRSGDMRRGDTASSNPAARNLGTLLTARMVVRLDFFS
jgi:hypothetical protein